MAIGFWFIGLLSVSPAQSLSTAIAARPKIASNYGTLPLSFEQNLGQVGEQVRYQARGSGYSILLDYSEAQLLLTHRADLKAEADRLTRPALRGVHVSNESTDSLEMRLMGRDPRATVSGETPLPGTVNYFIGNDPTKWHTAIPTFERVRYSGVYPGVDLTYYGNRQRMEFDFDLSPGADPHSIRLRFDGARRLRLDKSGNLLIVTANGQVGFEKPVVYQPLDGNDRKSVEGAFRILSDHTVAFALGRYDGAKPLVIDPILNYSTYLGEGGGAYAIAIDAAGEAFITGSSGNNFPATPGAFQPVSGCTGGFGGSAFVAKLSSDGSHLIYATYLGGSSVSAYSAPSGITVDSAGNAYIAGTTSQDDFPTTPGAFQTTNRATFSVGSTGFVSKLNNSGTGLDYSTYIGGSVSTNPTNQDTPEDAVYAIAVDASGNAFITGSTISKDFPVTAGAFQLALAAGNTAGTAFVAQLNPAGSGLVYGTYLGGSDSDLGVGIALDLSGNAVVGGGTTSADFPLTSNAVQSSKKAEAGVETGFVTKVNNTGSSLVYSTYLGGSKSGGVNAIAVDGAGSAYVTGITTASDFPVTSNVFQKAIGGPGYWNAFVAKINNGGTVLDYSTYLGGTFEDYGTAIAVDSSGDAYVVGNVQSGDFPVTDGAFEPPESR